MRSDRTSSIDPRLLNESVPQSRRGRVPGVLGTGEEELAARAGSLAGRGPLGIVTLPGTIFAAPPGGVVASLTYTLPPPETNWTAHMHRLAKISLWKKLDESGPKLGDLKQQGIPNCYLAATLAAMANTDAGRKVIKKMVTAKTGRIVTICHDYDSDGAKGAAKKIDSDRYFVVKFNDGVERIVSDVFYMDDSDRDWNPRYMDSPKNLLWACVIEAAYASAKGSFDAIGAGSGLTISAFLNDLVGKNYIMFHFETGKKWVGDKSADLKDDDLKAALKKAGTVPTIAASKVGAKSVTGFHGFAVLGMSGSKVKLYDPLKLSNHEVDLKTLAADFQAVFLLNV